LVEPEEMTELSLGLIDHISFDSLVTHVPLLQPRREVSEMVRVRKQKKSKNNISTNIFSGQLSFW
jgi:hypothetical protein